MKRTFVLCLTVGIAGALLVVALHLVRGEPIAYFTRDVSTVLHGNPYAGILSSLSILGWSVAVTGCFLSALVLRREKEQNERASFFFTAGALSAILLLDDLLLFHEGAIPNRLGIPEQAVIATYGLLTAAFLYRFRKTILTLRYGTLLAAFVLFALSVLLDELAQHDEMWWILAEDGSKFGGICFWAGFYLESALALLRSASLANLTRFS